MSSSPFAFTLTRPMSVVVPAVNAHSCADEIEHVEKWSNDNNLSLNRKKSVEIVFVSPWSKRAVMIPDKAVSGIERVDSIKVFGVTMSRRLSIAEHVDNLLATCSQTLFAMCTLKQHCLPTSAHHTVYQATVVACLVGLCQLNRQRTTGSFSPLVESTWLSRTIRSKTGLHL